MTPVAELRVLREELMRQPASVREDFYAALDEQSAADLFYAWGVWARPDQLVPEGDWFTWCILAGRGWGKTRTGAEFVKHEAAANPNARIALLGANPKDARDVMIEGESGILANSHPSFRPQYNSSLASLVWPNGAMAKAYSAETPEALRGPQHTGFWVDEPIKFRFLQESWDQLMFGMRLGRKPRGAVTTTPKPFKWLIDLKKGKRVHVTSGSTYDNAANLAEDFLEFVLGKYKGTSLEAQEIYAQILEDIEGALWNWALIERSRAAIDPETLKPTLPAMRRVVIGVDPSVSSNEGSDETGMVAAGLGEDGKGYVLADFSGPGGFDRHASPLVLEHYPLVEADMIVGEVNNGGDLVGHTVATVRDANDKPVGQFIPFKKVHASRGKKVRAEPVKLLYEQGRVKHVGTFAELEGQMTSWDARSGKKSPDRMDALVWALTELMIDPDPEPRLRGFSRR